MTQKTDPFILRVRRYFTANPRRTYFLTAITLDQINASAEQKMIAGVASCPNATGILYLSWPQGADELTCIVRRPKRGAGEVTAKVFILDGVPYTSPPKGPAKAREMFCDRLWRLFEIAQGNGVSFKDLFLSPAGLAAALEQMGPVAPADV